MNIRPLCTFLLCAALADPTHAAIVTETETDGTSVNNSLVTAPAIAGTYYIGVSQFANLATVALTGTETPIARPDGKDGGLAVTGVPPGVATYDFNGTQPGNAFYTLHVSLGTGAPNAVPEPATYALSGAALLLIGAIGRRNKSNNQ